MQKRILRALAGVGGRTSCRDLFKQLRIMTAPAVYIFQLAIYADRNLEKLRTVGDHHTYPTRGRDALEYPMHRTTLFERGPLYRAIKIYNKLPCNLKSYRGREFEVRLRKMLVGTVFYTLGEFFDASF